MHRRMERFLNEFCKKSLHSYFNLSKHHEILFKIDENDQTLDTEQTLLRVNFLTKRQNKFYDIGKLPEEISKEIYEYYNFDIIDIDFILAFSPYYPFKPPILKLHELKCNLSTTKQRNIKGFVKMKVDDFNRLRHRKKYGWSPSVNIEKEILYIYTSILPIFEYYHFLD